MDKKKRKIKKEKQAGWNKKRQTTIDNFKEKIIKHNSLIWCPDANHKYKTHKQNKANKKNKTWFKIKVGKSEIKHKLLLNKSKAFKSKSYIKCKKIIMKFNNFQKNIINKWLTSYALMYNETLKLIKDIFSKNGQTILNFKILRTYHLKDKRNEIINYYADKTQAPKVHNLDFAIKLACANYKSALSNYKNGHIKKFRIKYWRHKRKNKIMDIENTCFSKTGLCFNTFGKINCTYNNKAYDLSNVTKTCKLQYNFNDNAYYLFVPEESKVINKEKKNEIISLDPGIRTFMTGISENMIVKIAKNSDKRIKKYLKLIDIRNNMNISNKIKKKNEHLYNRKITHLVDELHWKSAKYLTDTFKQILIGNMSVKGISKRGSNLNNMTKRIALRLRFFTFKQRLQYKCETTNTKYKEIDESYTSKMCSKCGYLKSDLGSSKIYNCTNCHITLDRDINGARGIFIKSL